MEQDLIDINLLLQKDPEKIKELQARKERGSNENNKNTEEDKLKSDNSNKMGGVRQIGGDQLQVSVANDEITNKIIKKVNSIESSVNDIIVFLKEVSSLKKQTQDHKEQLDLHDKQLIDMNNKIEAMKLHQDEVDRQIKDIQSKVEDFNVIELLKNSGGGQGGDFSVALGLIQNLEKKFVQKFKFTDERLTKNEEDVLKFKTESTNLKNMQDSNNRNIQTLNEKHETLSNEVGDLLKKINDMQNTMINDLNTKYENLNKLMNEKIKELTELMENKMKEMQDNLATLPNTSPNNETENNGDESKQIREIMKKIAELEKAIKIIPSQINIEAVWTEISAMKTQMADKAIKLDYEELKNMINEMQKQINYLKDQLETLIEDQTDHDDIQNLKRRLESLANKVIELRANENESSNVNNSNSIRPVQIDTSKFVEITIFNNFKQQLVKEFENVNDNFASMRRMIDDIINTLKSKTTFKDLKTLEDDVMAKLEDLKLASAKKFADKIETGKNVKYLDQQIKHTIEVYIKKMEKCDNWLLAKKPLGGHLCASCENYIGDLKDSNTYVPWNKYPMRDPNDKLYRIGNGFSKMLQMITVDGQSPDRRDVNFQTSQEFYENSKTTGNVREHSEPKNGLPKIKTKRNITVENDEDNMQLGDVVDVDEIDPTQPKM